MIRRTTVPKIPRNQRRMRPDVPKSSRHLKLVNNGASPALSCLLSMRRDAPCHAPSGDVAGKSGG